MKFSIIVPIYNVERYLGGCIDSILCQPYKDFELILVDDGSTDKCPQICDEYGKMDSRIRVVHQKNSGLSGARNTGLSICMGQYIVFVDSDDELYPDALSKAADIIGRYSDPDIMIGNIAHWDGRNEKIVVNNAHYMEEQESKSILDINELFAREHVQLPWRAYQSIYKKDFMDRNSLRFKEDVIGAEDCELYLRVIGKGPTYRMTDAALVKYRVHREGSIINSPSYDTVKGQLETFAAAFEKAVMFHDIKLMKEYFANKYVNIILLVNLLRNESERESCYRHITDHKDILRYTSRNAKYCFAKIVWGIFGIPKGSELLLKINKVRKRV